MKTKRFLPGLAAAVALGSLLLTVHPAAAQDPEPTATAQAAQQTDGGDRRVVEGDQTNVGGNYVLQSDQTLNGDFAIIGGSVTFEEGSVINGDVMLLGGSLTANGEIKGDLAQLGGTVRLGDAARVGGKFESLGGSRSVAGGAFVRSGGSRIELPEAPATPTPLPRAEVKPEVRRSAISRLRDAIRDATPFGDDDVIVTDSDNWSIFSNDGKVFPGAILITLLAVVAAVLVPRNIMQAVDLAQSQTLLSGGVGFLSVIAGSIVLGVLSLALCTIPLTASAGFVAVVLGWTVTARIVGEYVMRMINKFGWRPLTVVAVGSVVMALLGAIPIVGDLIGMAFVSVGLGALVLTRGGTRRYVMIGSGNL